MHLDSQTRIRYFKNTNSQGINEAWTFSNHPIDPSQMTAAGVAVVEAEEEVEAKTEARAVVRGGVEEGVEAKVKVGQARMLPKNAHGRIRTKRGKPIMTGRGVMTRRCLGWVDPANYNIVHCYGFLDLSLRH